MLDSKHTGRALCTLGERKVGNVSPKDDNGHCRGTKRGRIVAGEGHKEAAGNEIKGKRCRGGTQGDHGERNQENSLPGGDGRVWVGCG